MGDDFRTAHADPMPHRIFLVEDNAVIREAMADMLQDVLGATVVAWADTEATAVQRMRDTAWDVVLVDLFLRQGSGLGVARSFMERPPDQRLYVLSNYATADIRQRCAALGVDGVFDKSTELDLLLAKLAN